MKLRTLAFTTLLALSSTAAANAQIMERPVGGDPVRLASGQVAGSALASGVRTYFGIPFAAPPLRDLRWREPQPVQAWTGVREAVAFPPMCPQGMRGPGQNHYFGAEPTSEDCLYVNVWAPPTSAAQASEGAPGAKASKAPVVVWIYGGGFSGGSASMPWANGETLASKGVVYVTLNYRLGALGFMAHPELTAESPHHASGDYGHLDQVAALKWVQDNIAAFGGDADNVTVIGQSAGSMSVSALQASPLSAGLFHRAIGLSGNVVGAGAGALATNEAAEAQGVALQTALGVSSLAEMRRLPADRIIGVRGVRTGPSIDGYFMPRPPKEIFAAGEANDVGLLIGFTRDEGFSPLVQASSAEDYQAIARRTYPDQADELLAAYPADANWARNARDAGRDISLGMTTRDWAAHQTRPGRQPAFGYMFSRVHPYAPGVAFIDHDPAAVGAYHAGDIVYWFGNLDAFNAYRTTRNFTAVDRTLSDTMSNMIVAFATRGDPSLPGVSAPRYDAKDEKLIELGEHVGPIDWPGRTRFDMLGSLKAQQQPPSSAAAPAVGSAPNAGPRF
ncbi:MAG TPA: carboxylesterase family protein [Brevundimonas sp.]|jgi:para-nitrobenzyl esterase